MRNDARPLGEASPPSPVGGDASPVTSQSSSDHPTTPATSPADAVDDQRGSVADDRQSHIVHQETAEREPDRIGEPATSPNPRTGGGGAGQRE
jgi:hypothetical protein